MLERFVNIQEFKFKFKIKLIILQLKMKYLLLLISIASFIVKGEEEGTISVDQAMARKEDLI